MESNSVPVWGRKYLIVSTNELYTEIYSGTCYGQYMGQPYYYFKNVLSIDRNDTYFNNKVADYKLFSANDKFYDIENIKNTEQTQLHTEPATLRQ